MEFFRIFDRKATSGVSDEFVSRLSFSPSTPCIRKRQMNVKKTHGRVHDDNVNLTSQGKWLWWPHSSSPRERKRERERFTLIFFVSLSLSNKTGDKISRQRVTTCDSASDSAWIPYFLFFLLVTSSQRTSLIKSPDSTGYLLSNVVLFLSSCILVPEKQHFLYTTREW